MKQQSMLCSPRLLQSTYLEAGTWQVDLASLLIHVALLALFPFSKQVLFGVPLCRSLARILCQCMALRLATLSPKSDDTEEDSGLT